MEDIRLFCGLSDFLWNHHVPDPGKYACISPVYGVGQRRATSCHVPPGTAILQDSGAFSDSFITGRLSFDAALARQDKHAERYDYADKITLRASYEVLIDESWSINDGVHARRKRRWSESAAEEAVEITVQAARFLNEHRNGLPCVLNVQGVTPGQYLRCVERVVPLLCDGDVLGLGGWCAVGRFHGLLPVFLETLAQVVPFLARESVSRVHLYGCVYTPALAALLAICDQHGIVVSLDSAYPAMAPAFGRWGYGSWRQDEKYPRPVVLDSCRSRSCAPDTHCRGLERIRHVKLTREWLACFRDREREMYERYAAGTGEYHTGQVSAPHAHGRSATVLPCVQESFPW